MSKIDELLGEDEEKETLSASPAEEKTDHADGDADSAKKQSMVTEYQELIKAREALQKEKEKLHTQVTQLREERRALQGQPAKTESASTSGTTLAPADNTFEAWVDFVNKRSSTALEPVMSELEKLKSAQKSKGLRRFIEKHPEYSTKNDPDNEKLKHLQEEYSRIRRRTEHDADDIYEDLEDTWAVLNRAELMERDERYRAAKERAEEETADLASSTGGDMAFEKSTPSSVKATASDYRAAKFAGKTIEEYLKLKRQLEESSIN